jgi:hypothetical protein
MTREIGSIHTEVLGEAVKLVLAQGPTLDEAEKRIAIPRGCWRTGHHMAATLEKLINSASPSSYAWLCRNSSAMARSAAEYRARARQSSGAR